MARKILVKRSAVAAKVPTTSDLDLGEIGINTYDGKLYIKKDNGTASIVEVGLGGATGGVIYENSQIVSSNISIASGKSGMSAGPITINAGVTVTVPTGSRWVVL